MASGRAELARVVRLNPTVIVEPMEPPQVRVNLISPQRSVDEMIPIALSLRPELTFTQAQAEAARERVQQEQTSAILAKLGVPWRHQFPPYPMGIGGFGGSFGGSTGSMAYRQDYDAEVVWELKNLGLGNLFLVREKRSAYDLARAEDLPLPRSGCQGRGPGVGAIAGGRSPQRQARRLS